MKKLFPLLLMSMAVMLYSCEKDDDSGSGDEDDISFDFPIDDALQEKLNRNIYNLNSATL